MRIYILAVILFSFALPQLAVANSVRCESLFFTSGSMLETEIRAADANDDYESLFTSANYLLTLDPDNLEVLRKKAKALFKLKRDEEALEVLERVLELDSTSLQALGMKSQILIRQGKYLEALPVLSFLLQHYPNNVSSLSLRAEALSKIGLFIESVVAASRHLVYAPDNIYSHFIKIDGYMNTSRFAEAEQQARDALRFHPTNIKLLRLLMLNLYKQQKFEDFLVASKKIESLGIQFLTMRANALTKLGRNEEALLEVDNSLALAPGNVRLITVKVDLLIKLKRFFEAQQLVPFIEDGFFKDYYTAKLLIIFKQHRAAIAILKNLDMQINIRWLLAQAYFVSGDMRSARLELVAILQKSKTMHFGAIAVLMLMQENGESTYENGLLEGLLSRLTPSQLVSVRALKKQDVWAYEPTSSVDEVSITNSFWNGLYNLPRNQQSFNSSYGAGSD